MKRLTTLLALALVAGCAYRPVIDPKGTNMNAYAKDLAECQAIAKANDTTGENAAIGAGVGAAIVGGLVAIITGNTRGLGRAAAAGAVAGGADGAAAGMAEQRMMVRRCLLMRGYRVLN